MEKCMVCGGTDLVGINLQGIYDGVLYWRCANGHNSPRGFVSPRLRQLSMDYAERATARDESGK